MRAPSGREADRACKRGNGWILRSGSPILRIMTSSDTTRRKHPHFDDRGTLDWNTSFAEAQAAAQRDGRHLFIEIGREL